MALFDTYGLSLLMGAAVGFVLALTGAGGGILAVPLLVFGLHLQMADAAPIGLLAVGLAAAIGALLGLRDGIVRYRAALLIGTTGMLLAPLGVRLGRSLPNAPLMAAFALVLAWVAWRSFHQSGKAACASPTGQPHLCAMNAATGRLTLRAPCVLALAGTGALSGLLSGLLGVGGGFVIVPMLSRISDVTMRGIVATSLAVIALVSVGGVAGAATQGGMAWSVALPFAAGAVLALLAGRRVSARLAGPRLQQAFGAVAGGVALLLLLRAVRMLAGG
ncbi:sulfite exporter TauE/SafE family protein [Variovorax dokdonensis]|uniref:Probable membrane transporter protein n=1 Tax=Variovorax dokdonensis TaxID=344883 RepID=A0ABT7NED0_9BURK|nr:sulfite exporter TauE/SafE family protein [Variovorax dokdonensis]MDM0046305.1 sulfite exporter TauE/SafE family protein [Variovorax dokdonensis]